MPETWNIIQVSHMDSRVPDTWTTFLCFLRALIGSWIRGGTTGTVMGTVRDAYIICDGLFCYAVTLHSVSCLLRSVLDTSLYQTSDSSQTFPILGECSNLSAIFFCAKLSFLKWTCLNLAWNKILGVYSRCRFGIYLRSGCPLLMKQWQHIISRLTTVLDLGFHLVLK